MAKFLLTVNPVRITTFELRYEIEAASPEEAEEIWRNPYKGAPITLIHQEKLSTGAPRREIPVVVVPLQTEFSFDGPQPAIPALQAEAFPAD